MCRHNICNTSIIAIKQEGSSGEIHAQTIKSKHEIILDICKQPNSKVIIFSYHDRTFEPILSLCMENDIKCIQLGGNADIQHKKLESFRHGECDVLFLNAKQDGAGLNLVEASDVIFYHKMSEYYTAQIIGRVNRIGRTKSANIHKIVEIK